MTILKEVAAELVGMFVGDAWLSAAALAVIAAAALLSRLDPLAGGAVLLAGSLGVLVESVRRASR